jgi:hypothetical protein
MRDIQALLRGLRTAKFNREHGAAEKPHFTAKKPPFHRYAPRGVTRAIRDHIRLRKPSRLRLVNTPTDKPALAALSQLVRSRMMLAAIWSDETL